MPKIIKEDELNKITTAIGGYAEGVSVSELYDALEGKISRRTLQRRLNKLVSSGRILSTGQKRSCRYSVPTLPEENIGNVKSDFLIPLSRASEAAYVLIKQPLIKRVPVSYKRTMIDVYQPNVTFYLSSPTIEHLSEIGKSKDSTQSAGTFAKKLYERLLIDLSWNSSRLEGNTYSLLETERLLHQGQPAEGKNAQETQMLLNHKAAIELIIDAADEISFNRYTICNLHALLSENLLPDASAGGRLRNIPVAIGSSVYMPLDNPTQLEETFSLILGKANAIENPFEQAFFAMVHLPYLQPFEDVNKRVSRLAANIPLIKNNLSPLSFVDVPQQNYVDALLSVYELNKIDYLRDVFFWAYERSCARYSAIRQSIGDPDPFRLQYRDQIHKLVAEIVYKHANKENAIRLISEYAGNNISGENKMRFIEVVETELNSLHEGNIARYRLRPQEFYKWKSNWQP